MVMTTAELISLIALILSILSAWAITSYKHGRMGNRVENNETRIKSLEESRSKLYDALALHKNEQIPHATCVGHTVTIQHIEQNITSINATLENMNKNILELAKYIKTNGNGRTV